MNFINVSVSLPNYGKRVIVRTSDDFYFTAILETDEEGEFWAYDLPIEAGFHSGEITKEIISWSYLPE